MFSVEGSAQQLMNLDSLLQQLNTAQEDSTTVLLYINIGQQYEGNEPETAKQYYRKALALSKQLSYTMGEIKYVANYGYVLNMQGYFDSTLQLNLRAVELARTLNDSLTYGKTLFNTGTSYRLLSRYEEAIPYYERGKNIFDRLGDEAITAQASDILQTLYRDLHQFDKAILLGEEAVRLCRKINNPLWLGTALTNLGTNYASVNRYDKAKACFTEALAISKSIGDKNMESVQYINLGDVQFQLGNYEGTKVYFESGLKLAEELETQETIAIAKKGLALYYIAKKNYPLAEDYAQDALTITYEQNLRLQRHKVLSVLSSLAYSMQDMRKGEYYGEQATFLSDSLLNETIQKNTLDLEVKYETARKDQELKLKEATIKQKSNFNSLLILSTVALVIVLFLMYITYKQRQGLQQQRINELEAEKKLTATEAVLKGEEQERTRMAKDLHDGLGGMLSGIKYSLHAMKGNMIMTPDNAQAFERSIDMLDSSIREMRRVAHNMMPEALVKFGLDVALKDFCNDINQSGILTVSYQSIGLPASTLNQTTSITIYRVVQELLNNTMKHASAKKAVVQISKEDNHISVTVEDDGKGFDPALLKKPSGMGWQNIESRIAYLKGKLDIQTAPGKGTSVLIEFTNV